MTRYARAVGCKAANARVPSDPTPWEDMTHPKADNRTVEDLGEVKYSSKRSKNVEKTPGKKIIEMKEISPVTPRLLRSSGTATVSARISSELKKSANKKDCATSKATSIKFVSPKINKLQETPRVNVNELSPLQTRSARKKKAAEVNKPSPKKQPTPKCITKEEERKNDSKMISPQHGEDSDYAKTPLKRLPVKSLQISSDSDHTDNEEREFDSDVAENEEMDEEDINDLDDTDVDKDCDEIDDNDTDIEARKLVCQFLDDEAEESCGFESEEENDSEIERESSGSEIKGETATEASKTPSQLQNKKRLSAVETSKLKNLTEQQNVQASSKMLDRKDKENLSFMASGQEGIKSTSQYERLSLNNSQEKSIDMKENPAVLMESISFSPEPKSNKLTMNWNTEDLIKTHKKKLDIKRKDNAKLPTTPKSCTNQNLNYTGNTSVTPSAEISGKIIQQEESNGTAQFLVKNSPSPLVSFETSNVRSAKNIRTPIKQEVSNKSIFNESTELTVMGNTPKKSPENSMVKATELSIKTPVRTSRSSLGSSKGVKSGTRNLIYVENIEKKDEEKPLADVKLHVMSSELNEKKFQSLESETNVKVKSFNSRNISKGNKRKEDASQIVNSDAKTSRKILRAQKRKAKRAVKRAQKSPTVEADANNEKKVSDILDIHIEGKSNFCENKSKNEEGRTRGTISKLKLPKSTGNLRTLLPASIQSSKMKNKKIKHLGNAERNNGSNKNSSLEEPSTSNGNGVQNSNDGVLVTIDQKTTNDLQKFSEYKSVKKGSQNKKNREAKHFVQSCNDITGSKDNVLDSELNPDQNKAGDSAEKPKSKKIFQKLKVQLSPDQENKIEKVGTILKKSGKLAVEIEEALGKQRKLLVKQVKMRQCFRCRQTGHIASSCPSGGAQMRRCFKCGDENHHVKDCPQKEENFKFADCYICHQQGHLAKSCPQNENGVYVNGGSCRICGDNKHLAKDCHVKNKKLKYQGQNTDKKMSVGTLRTNQSADADIDELPAKITKKSLMKTVVKF